MSVSPSRAEADRPRVLFVNRFFRPDLSATSQMVTDVATGLAARGMAVSVVTSAQHHDRPDEHLPLRETIDGVAVRRIPTSRFGRHTLLGRAMDYLTFHLGAALAVARLARRGTIVVACTDPPMLSVSVAPAAWLRGARRVNWMLDVYPETATELGVLRPGGLVDRVMRRLRDASLRGGAVNVVLGERMVARFAEMGIDDTTCRVIHNFADGRLVTVQPRDHNPLRTAWGLDGKFVVGYSGNLGRAHEFDTILGAAETLRERDDIVFLFIGDGHRRSALKTEAERRGLGNIRYEPLQPRETLSLSLGVPDVHLVSLRPPLEGLIVPSKVYGILAAGRPTLFIGDTDGEVARLVRRHDCGAAVAVGAAEALAQEIARLAAAPELWRRWAGNARRAFDSLFDRDIAVAQWTDMLTAPPAAASAPAGDMPAAKGLKS